MKRRLVIWSLGSIAGLYIALSFVGGAIAMRIPRLPVVGSPAAVGVSYQDVSFPARFDGTLLKGWYIAGKGESVIVIVHGGFQSRVDDVVNTLGLARDLNARGYDVLLFDLRGRGESGGRGRALSNIEPDLGGTIDFLKTKGYSEQSIVFLGFCSGAATASIYASNNPVGALVLDGDFSTVDGMVVRQAAVDGIPAFLVRLFIPGLTVATRLMYGFAPINPIDVVPSIRSPILFIHEQNDDIVSWKETTELFSASGDSRSQIWQISSAKHSEGYRVSPAEYVAKVDGFLSGTLSRSVR